MKHLIDKRFLLGAILVFLFLAVTNYENGLKHSHVVESYPYANGVKQYEIVYCETLKQQVVFRRDHRETYNSIKYFNTEQ